MMGDESEAELQLAALAAEVVNDLSNYRILELAAAGRAARELSPRQRTAAISAGEHAAGGIVPDRPGFARHCDICGSTRAELVHGIDGPGGAMVCRDERQCEARRNHRFTRPDLVPSAVMDVLGRADDAQAAQAARQQAQQQQAVTEQAVARQMWHPPGWTSVPGEGSVDEFGQWHPEQPPARPLVPPPPQPHGAYSHTLINPHNRSHLLSGQPRPHYYGGAFLSGAESAGEPPGPVMPAVPAGSPDRSPARGRGRSRRAGLRYTGRRLPALKPRSANDGDFHSGVPDTGGPDGGSASADT